MNEVRIETDRINPKSMIASALDWLVFKSELDYFSKRRGDFEDFSLVHIFRNENVRTGSLAK